MAESHRPMSLPLAAISSFMIGVLLLGRFATAQGIKLTPAQRARAHGELPLTKFYETPVPLPAGKPGDLIRSEPFDDYDLPDGVSAVRILYHSVAATGEDVAASGVVLIPRGPAPQGGWNVIAWAHPFMAVARPCAPSLMRALGSGSVLSMFANVPYAVVAADFTGLGTTFRNAAFDIQSNAADVINAVIAAHKAVPQLGAKWIAIGEGNGGASALSIAERETTDPEYLGSISVSGELDLQQDLRQERDGGNDRLAYLVYGAQTVFPGFKPDEVFTAKGLARYQAVTAVCSPPPAAASPLSRSANAKSGWESNPSIRQFFARNILGAKPAKAPVLIVSAEDSRSSMDSAVVARMCGRQDHVDFMDYRGVDPNDLMGGTIAAQMAWIKARFQGRMTANTCR